jgi:glycosyltransferase involved in cell wall biosynthesis
MMKNDLKKENNLLIISYTFPPASGIGGRRWTKFGKYLHKAGYKVTVLSAAAHSKTEYSSWQSDIYGLNVKIFKSHYPKVLTKVPSNLFEKINYRLKVNLLSVLTKGSIYDRASLDEDKIISEASKIIVENCIGTLIVTGAPFSILYYGVLLKKRFPLLNLIADIRDPWTWGENYGFLNLRKSRMDFECKRLNSVLEHSDYITVPAVAMKKYLEKIKPEYTRKFIVLPHAVDPEDFTELEKRKRTNKIRLIYGGTLYDNIEPMFDKLLNAATKCKEEDFVIDFFADSYFYKKKVQHYHLSHKIFFKPLVSNKEFLNEIRNADYFLLLYPEKYKDFLSTKFTEVVMLNIPIIYVGYEGYVSAFINENKLGVSILLNESENFFVRLLSKNLKLETSGYKGINSFFLESIVKDIIEPILVKN